MWLIHSVTNKTLGKKKKKNSGWKTNQMRAALVTAGQVEGDDPSHCSPWGEQLGGNQWSLWVPCDTAELENYAGYTVSCSTWEAQFTHLFNEIITYHVISVICTMRWQYKDSSFTQQPSADNSEGTRGQPSPFCCERGTRQWGWPPIHLGVLTSGQMITLLVLKLEAASSKEAIRGP